MKRALLAFVGIVFAVNGGAFAQENDVGKALDSFAKVAGAWHLNQKCAYLEANNLPAFEDSVALITTTLRKGLGDEKILHLIQRSAKETVASEEYGSCEETRSLFISGYAHSINWSAQIRKILQKQGLH